MLGQTIGGRKVYWFLDARHSATRDMRWDNRDELDGNPDHRLVNPHGTWTAGVAAANANPTDNFGVVGAAPNARIISVIYPDDPDTMSRIWKWMAGLDPLWSANRGDYKEGLPPRLASGTNTGPGASIISNSFDFGDNPINAEMWNTVNDVVWYGRGRRGTVFVFSAGNAAQRVEVTNPLGEHRKLIVVGASTLRVENEFPKNTTPPESNFANLDNLVNRSEVLAPYSSFSARKTHGQPEVHRKMLLLTPSTEEGADPEMPRRWWIAVDVSAPSHSAGHLIKWSRFHEVNGVSAFYDWNEPDVPVHNPPYSYAIVTSSFLDQNNEQREPKPRTAKQPTLQSEAHKGEENIYILNLDDLVDPSIQLEVYIDNPFSEKGELAIVKRISGNLYAVTKLKKDHAAGASILPVYPGIMKNDLPGKKTSDNYTVTTDQDVHIGDKTVRLSVASDPKGAIDNAALIGDPADGNAEGIWIAQTGADSGKLTIGLDGRIPEYGFKKDHADEQNVFMNDATHLDSFGGTSSAAALVSGIAALVLSAKPTLTNIEVREILRTTATKIDPMNRFLGEADTDTTSASNFAIWNARLDGWHDKDGEPIYDDRGILRFIGDPEVPATLVGTMTPSIEDHFSEIQPSGSITRFSVGQIVLIGAIGVLKRVVSPTEIEVECAGKEYESALNTALEDVQSAGFWAGQMIQVGAGPITHLTRDVSFSSTIQVASTAGFQVGQQIHIQDAGRDAQGFLITDVISHNELAINPGISVTPDIKSFPPKMVRPFHFEPELVKIQSAIGSTITLDSSTPLTRTYPAMSQTGAGLSTAVPLQHFVTIAGTEARVILEIADGKLKVPPVSYIHDGSQNIPVAPRRTPCYHRALGYGRVDAARAVEAAIAYDHGKRDLMIRNHVDETGVTRFTPDTTKPISSPDIWVRNNALDIAAIDALNVTMKTREGDAATAVYNTPGPHQNPSVDDHRVVYVRIRNLAPIIDGKESLEASVRLYIAVTNRSISELTLEDFQSTIVSTAGGPTYYQMSSGAWSDGTEFLGENYAFVVPESTVPGIPLPPLKRGIAPQCTYVTGFRWLGDQRPPKDTPSVASRKRIYILAEITPHDGVVSAGSGDPLAVPDNGNKIWNNSVAPGENNNIAVREISFAEMEVLGTDNLALNGTVAPDPVPGSSGDPVPKPFHIKAIIRDRVGYFDTRHVSLKMTVTSSSGAKTVIEFRHDGTGWVQTGTLPGLTIRPPKLTPPAGTTDADGNQYEIYFPIDWNVQERYDIKFQYFIRNDANAIIGTGTISAPGTEDSLNYEELDVQPPSMPDVFGFGEIEKFMAQTTGLSFGPKSPYRYRLTNSFISRAAEPVKAFAAVTGRALLQRIVDPTTGSHDPERVNLIIAPLDQPSVEFPPVRYMVYRGLRLRDFLDQSDPTVLREVPGPGDPPITDPDLAPSSFIAELFRVHRVRRQDMIDANVPSGELPGEIPVPKALGWDPSQSATTSLATAFAGTHDFQLPIVRRGAHIGNFFIQDDAEFGFEIVLDDARANSLDLAYARKPYHEIDLTSAPDNALTGDALSARKEDVLAFVDAAAYYGMFHDLGVEHPDGSLKRGEELYSAILTPFANRHRIYLDIRSEHGRSLNYHGNYGLTGAPIQIGPTPDDMVPAQYGSDGWPLVTLDRATEQVVAGNQRIFLSLTVNDNTKPLLYIEHGTPTTTASGRFIPTETLAAVGDEWTSPVGLSLPSVVDPDLDETLDVAGILRLRYFRMIPDTPAAPVERAIEMERYTDNVFGPVSADADVATPTGTFTTWITDHERVFIDGRSSAPVLDFGAVVERGVALLKANGVTTQAMYYTAPVDYYRTGGAVLPREGGGDSGFSPRPTFLGASSLFGEFEIKTTRISDGSLGIDLPSLEPRAPGAIREGIMLLGITAAERTALQTAAATLSDAYPRNFVLVGGSGLGQVSSGGITFYKYQVHVRGILPLTHQSTDVPPAAPIVVYSIDGLLFVSSGTNLESIFPTSYLRTAEELRAMLPEPTTIVTEAAAIWPIVNGFNGAVAFPGVPDDDSAAGAIGSAITTLGTSLWTEAHTATAGGHPDDRPLYWARLRMAAAMKSHRRLLKNSAERALLVEAFEKATRGFESITFGSVGSGKKVLVVALDPYGFDTLGLEGSNPAGVVALELSGESVSGTGSGQIESVLLPVRYEDYDGGYLERLFEQYIFDPAKRVHMILVLGRNGTRDFLSLERFAGRGRSKTAPDNMDRKSADRVGAGSEWLEFYPTTIPVNAMMQGQIGRSGGQIFYFNQSYLAWSYDATGNRSEQSIEKAGTGLSGPNETSHTAPAPTGVAVEGSGGAYLANEVFYRLAHLAANPPAGLPASSIAIGLLDIPDPSITVGPGPGGLDYADIVQEVKDAIGRVLGLLV